MPVDGLVDWMMAQGEDAPLLLSASQLAAWQERTVGSVGIAVSGGSDSMAMLHLLSRVAPRLGWSVRAVTVDHRLRPEAADEAAFVGRICQSLGVPHDILLWKHDEVAGNLMQAASDARYGLMAAWARDQGLDLIVLAHTADDQAETFLMGLSRAAGLDGLSGMRPHFDVDGMTFCRPLLGHPREALRGFLSRHRLDWVDDPSNDNDRFARVKARHALKALKPLGITVDRLSTVIANLSSSQRALHHAVAETAKTMVEEKAGALYFHQSAFLQCAPEVQRRLLIAMVQWIAGSRHAPRENKIAALGRAVVAGRDATLAGVRFRWSGEACTVSREARACGAPVPAGQLWDGRWWLEAPMGEVRALGAAGLRSCPEWRALGLSRQVLEVTPGLWHGDHLIAAPCAGLGNSTATLTASFSLFLLSH